MSLRVALGLIASVTLFLLTFLFTGDFKVPQKEVVMLLNIANQVNICLPEDDKGF